MKHIILLGLLTLAACDAKTVTVETDPSKATYSRDTRTDICFASFGRAARNDPTNTAKSFSVTAVPCSPEVLALVPSAQRVTVQNRR